MREMKTNRKTALGMGLNELFDSGSLSADEIEENIVKSAKETDIVLINLDELRANPYQPRKIFDEDALEELSKSIKEHGVFQPIIVKKSVKGYEIIAGERRVRASKLANLETVPAIIRDFTDSQMMQIALLENLQRENLSAIEEAKAYKNIIDELGITQDELAKKLGKSRSHITNMIGLLRLPLNIQDLILENKISMGHARVLSKLESNDLINELATKIVDEKISVASLEDLVKQTNPDKKVTIKKKENSGQFTNVQRYMSDTLGTPVKITDNKITIKFTSVHDLNRILEIINIDINE